MKNKTGRRSFIKQISVTGTAAIIPAGVLPSDSEQKIKSVMRNQMKKKPSNVDIIVNTGMNI